MVNKTSLLQTILKKSTRTNVFFSIFLYLIIICFISLKSLRSFEQETHYWKNNLRDSLLTHLLDSDYDSIQKKIKLVEKTNLFQEIVVTDSDMKAIYPAEVPAISQPFIPIEDQYKTVWGFVAVKLNYRNIFNELGFFFLFLFLIGILYVIIYSFVQIRLLKTSFEPLNELVESLNRLNESLDERQNIVSLNILLDKRSHFTEITTVNDSVSNLFHKLVAKNVEVVSLITMQKKMEEHKIISEMAKQVAHDIKSPLAALEVVMDDIKQLPEDSRDLTLHAINRIQEIANKLSKEGKKGNKEELSMPSISIVNIVNEKKMEYQGKNLNFILSDSTSQNSFVKLVESDFSRLISNLINNAVEAMDFNGVVNISLKKLDTTIEISIKDSGNGFPLELINGEIRKGNTIGKENGQGLGLYHADETVRKFGGSLEISNHDEGAIVKIILPLAVTPTWFLSKFEISQYQKICVIDDDQSIHDVWVQLLKKNNIKSEVLHAYNHAEIDKILDHSADLDFVMIDYDLRSGPTGIDYIKKYNLKNVVLVTSNYDTKEVVDFCLQNNIQMIPKQIVSKITIS